MPVPAVPLAVLMLAAPRQGGGAPEVPSTAAPPVIDGLLEDACWKDALRLGPFTEVDPAEGAAADPQTEVRLIRDQEQLFVAITCFEPEPESMVLQNMRRDAFLNDDDRVEFILDTFHDRRTAYFFQVSAAGSRGDALLNDNGRRFNKRWDTWWQARVVIHRDRWTVEVAIPFQALAFGEQGHWGFNCERFRGAGRVRSRWRGARRQYRLHTVSEAGGISGFTGLSQGLGLELLPFLKARREQTNDPRTGSFLATGGGEVNWRITPQLTGSLTVNTDFAETEVDDRQVNLSRFPLFFPEKRGFFLEDSTLFEFGEQAGFRGPNNFVPFFSRRIGLDPSGREVPLDLGARLAGRAGPLDLGVLAVRTGSLPSAGIPSGDIFVTRPSLNLEPGVALGALFTSGNPFSRAHNTVVGADLRINRTDWLPGNFSLNLYGLRSSDGASGEVGGAHGAQASLRTRDWSFSAEHLSTQASFVPALGFVRRPGERRFAGRLRWEPRPEDGPVRLFFFQLEPSVWTDLSGDTQSFRLATTFFGVEWDSGDRFSLRHLWEGDRVVTVFTPVPGSAIAAGFYDWQEVEAALRLSSTRAVSGSVSLRGGSWYDGSAGRLRASLEWRPGPALRLGLTYREDRVNLPGGDFDARLGILNADVSFSPDVSLETLLQADNVSDATGLQSRLRWIEADGREAFLVLNLNWTELPGGALVPVSQDLTLKVVFALRF